MIIDNRSFKNYKATEFSGFIKLEANMSCHIKKFRKGFAPGKFDWITYSRDKKNNTGINFGIGVLDTDFWNFSAEGGEEGCLVLLNGHGWIENEELSIEINRNSLFDENPTCIHFANQEITIKRGKTKYLEFAYVEALNNPKSFFAIYSPEKIKSEIRGEGTTKRMVKTIFDYDSRPDSNLVVGEVISLPGRYSSAPSHHHPQPEIYFYRFLPEHGFGFAELGENKALKIRHNDAVKILNNADHIQTTAPGYAMWYLWIIRHLPGNPYKGFEYNPKHEWILDLKAKIWKPDWA